MTKWEDKRPINLKWYMKMLSQTDIDTFTIGGLQDIPNIPERGSDVVVVDWVDGEEAKSRFHATQHRLQSLRCLWTKLHRNIRLKAGNYVGIALDLENRYRIYINFEYEDDRLLYKLNIGNYKNVGNSGGQTDNYGTWIATK